MNQNKFLEKYPVLRDPKIGDIVEVIALLDVHHKPMEANHHYYIGDIGKIIAADLLYVVDFNNQENNIVIYDGRWSLWKEEFKIIKIYNEK